MIAIKKIRQENKWGKKITTIGHQAVFKNEQWEIDVVLLMNIYLYISVVKRYIILVCSLEVYVLNENMNAKSKLGVV